MKIMLIGPYPPPYGGVSVHIQRLKYYLEKNGHRCFVCNFSDTKDALKNDVISLTSVKKIWKKKGNLFRETSKINPDIIHIHHCGSGFFKEMKPIFFWYFMKKRIFITFHGGSLPTYIAGSTKKDLLGLGLILRMAETIVCVNDEQVGALVKNFGNGVKKKIRTITPFLPPIPQDSNKQPMLPAAKNFYVRKDQTLTVIGAWQRYHRFEYLIHAFSMLHKDEPAIGLVILASSGGDQNYRKEILSLIRVQKLEKDILILEDVGDVTIYLRKASVFIRTSAIDSYSISVAEAIWLGIPVIANGKAKRPFNVIAYRDGSIESLHEKLLEVIRTRIGPSNYNERHTLMLNAMLPLKIYK